MSGWRSFFLIVLPERPGIRQNCIKEATQYFFSERLMAIQFFGSPTPTIGVEVEIQLIDPETRDLIPKSIALLEHCRTQGIERVKAEITQSMAEIDTEISKDVKDCRGYLEKRIAQIRG